MPSVSNAQRRKMGALFKQGKITKKQWNEFKVVKPSKKKKRKKKKS